MNKNKKGIAVILVLGLLSMLMIAAVAFSISMRIERSGATNFKHNVAAKHMMWSAIAQAIDDIDYSMDPNPPSGNYNIYPTNDIIVSTGSVPARVLSKAAMDFIPGVFKDAVENADPKSQYIDDSEGSHIGRFAYIAVNCSGLLDVNMVDRSDRMFGTNSSEITVRGVPEITDYNIFKGDLYSHVAYETLPELVSLNQGISANTNFIDYSRFPPLEEFDPPKNGVAMVYIGGDEAYLIANKTDIIDALTTALSGSGDPSFIFDNLTDYIDEDCVPWDMEDGVHDAANSRTPGPYTEAIPMINEVLVTGMVSWVSSTICEVTVRPKIELFYPFIETNANTFILYTELEVTVKNTSTPFTITGSKTMSLGLNKNKYQVSQPGQVLVSPIDAQAGENLEITVKMRMNVKVNNPTGTLPVFPAGSIVDAVPYPIDDSPLTFSANIAAPLQALSPAVISIPSKETVDPRFNWDCSTCWRNNINGSDTISTIDGKNSIIQKWFDMKDPSNDEGYNHDLDMYVSDKGKLGSVGELGNLLRGLNPNTYPLRTIRLFDYPNAQLDQVLKYFTVNVNTNDIQRGLVNMNATNSVDVIKSVFFNAPLYYEGASVPKEISDAEAYNIATNFIANGIARGGYSNRYDELGEIGWRTILPNPHTDLEREAAIANSYQLMGLRNNFFVIILKVDSYVMGMGGLDGATVASANAIVELWRDPVRDYNGNHPCFIRFFKWLDN